MVIVSNVMRAGHDRERCYRKTNRKNAIMQTIDEVKKHCRMVGKEVATLDQLYRAKLQEYFG